LSLTSADSNQEGTTEFITPGQVAERVVDDNPLPILARTYRPNNISMVAEYLAKPIPITTGAWATTDTASTLLFNEAVWTGIFANTMWKEKLHGFFGLKCKVKVELTLNATPFQQGRLRLAYYPAASLNRRKAASHKSHRVPFSQLPGVEIGTADSSVSLMIPYVNPQRFIELSGNIWDHGDVYLMIMSALVTGPTGPTTADYTIWYSLHDVELYGQTNRAVSGPQSGTGKIKSRRVNPSEQEMKPISHLLGAAATFTGEVSKIPILSLYAGPVSWFLNAAKGAALSFGLSKPLNTEQPCLMSMNYHYQCTTSDGFDNSVPLALLYDSKLRLLDGESNGGQDEMSIPFIASQWSYLDSFSLSTSNTPGQSLYVLGLEPKTLFTNAGTNAIYRTPLSYLSRLFKMYRGGFEVAFKLVKTGFHAGSLAISFVPGPSDGTLNLTSSAYTYRTIVDIQEGDYMCFRCPYLLPLDFIDTHIGCGRLYVNVVNPLRSPETCSPAVDVLVYIRGAESMQFQCPMLWDALPLVTQGGDVNETSTEIVCSAPGNAPLSTLQLEFCQESMSEHAGSLLQLLKRYNSIRMYSSDDTGNFLTCYPWIIGASKYISPDYTLPQNLLDFVASQVHAPFAFFRGGVRFRAGAGLVGGDIQTIRLYRGEGADISSGDLAYDGSIIPSPYTAMYSNHYNSGSGAYPKLPTAENGVMEGGLSVQIPYQGPYRMSPIHLYNGENETVAFEEPRPRLLAFVGEDRTRTLWRSYADDYQLLFWVGVPRFDA
jgi:hypothetical protein